MNWCFAIVNNRLAEVYFEKKGKGLRFLGHCYVKREEYKTKKEQKQIEKDTKKCHLKYRNGVYEEVGLAFLQGSIKLPKNKRGIPFEVVLDEASKKAAKKFIEDMQ